MAMRKSILGTQLLVIAFSTLQQMGRIFRLSMTSYFKTTTREIDIHLEAISFPKILPTMG